MSERERMERERAESLKDEGDSSTEQETPDVEAHRMEGASRAEAARLENEGDAEDRHRNSDV